MQRAIGVVLALGALSIPFACREATQMTIEVRLFGDLPCEDVQAVGIIARRDRDAAERALQNQAYTTEIANPSCTSGSIGTLVLTPEESSGAVIVAARVIGTGICAAPDYKGCIVARRAFQFIDHKPLYLPITLEARCVDVPCDAASSCRATQCTSSDVSCGDDGTCTSTAEPQAAGDGGSVLPDGAIVTTPPPKLGEEAGVADSGSDAPSGDAGSDASDGGELVDGGSDSGSSNLGTDICPTMPASSECSPTGIDCCDPPSAELVCVAEPTCKGAGSFAYRCRGAKNCPSGQRCCLQPIIGTAFPRSACGDCMGLYKVMCTTDADCPPTLPTCSAMFTPEDFNRMGTPVRICGP